MTYELWDSSTSNCLGSYTSEGTAMDTVAQLARQYGPQAREVVGLGLIEEHDDGSGRLIAEGDALVSLALTTLAQR